MKNKIRKELKKYLILENVNLKDIPGYRIESFTMENESWLGFEVVERTTNNDGWMEALTGITVKDRYLVITFDHNVCIDYDNNKFDDVVDELFRVYEDYKVVKSLLK